MRISKTITATAANANRVLNAIVTRSLMWWVVDEPVGKDGGCMQEPPSSNFAGVVRVTDKPSVLKNNKLKSESATDSEQLDIAKAP